MEEIIDRFMRSHRRPRFERLEKEINVLLLAPHADDEVIGAGGSLLKHVELGNPIHIVFITDGRLGRMRKEDITETIATRKREAHIVCEMLGAKPYFLQYEDGAFYAEQDRITALCDIIERLDPDLIYVPHVNDAHRDHFMTNVLLSQALDKLDTVPTAIWQYEVWTPLQPNAVINISAEFKKKQALLSVYESQLKLIPYQEMMQGLNQYRVSSIPFPGITHVEAFVRTSADEYINQMQELLEGDC